MTSSNPAALWPETESETWQEQLPLLPGCLLACLLGSTPLVLCALHERDHHTKCNDPVVIAQQH